MLTTCLGVVAIAQVLLANEAHADQVGHVMFDNYEMLDVGELPVTQASSVMGLIAKFLPEIEEPLATDLLSLTISGDGYALVVEAQFRGYLDDAIAGENFKARLVPEGGLWRIEALGRQTICARGPQRGMVARRCP